LRLIIKTAELFTQFCVNNATLPALSASSQARLLRSRRHDKAEKTSGPAGLLEALHRAHDAAGLCYPIGHHTFGRASCWRRPMSDCVPDSPAGFYEIKICKLLSGPQIDERLLGWITFKR
jgi:hypothetical protein